MSRPPEVEADSSSRLPERYDRETSSENRSYPLKVIDTEIRAAVAEVLERAGADPHLVDNLPIAATPDNKPGDFGIPCFALAKELHRNAADIARDLAEALSGRSGGYVHHYEATGPFLNAHLDYQKFGSEVAGQVVEMGGEYGKENIGHGAHIIIDMSSPNIAKRMSIGHLRSTIIGHSLARIHEALGYQVTKDNHIGDWGVTFGHLLHAIKTIGDEASLDASENPIADLQKLYEEITRIGKEDPQAVIEGQNWAAALEAGDPEAKQLWEKIIKWSFVEFQRMYDILGVEFDVTYGESFYEPFLQSTVDRLKKSFRVGSDGERVLDSEGNPQPVATSSKSEKKSGALVIDLNDVGLGEPVVMTSRGTSVYLTRDLAAAIYRIEQMQADGMLYVVGSEQKTYFQWLFETLRRLGYSVVDKSAHVDFGLVTLDGQKMSTRKGNVILLENLINAALVQARQMLDERGDRSRVTTEEEKEELARKIAMGGLFFTQFAQGRNVPIDVKSLPSTEINLAELTEADEDLPDEELARRAPKEFDLSSMLAMDGKSGVYIQYMHARCKSLLEKANFTGEVLPVVPTNNEEKTIVRHLAKFSEAVQQAGKDKAPHVIATYVFELAQLFSALYDKHSVLGDASPVSETERQTRVMLTAAVAQSLKNGLYMLGIEAPDRM